MLGKEKKINARTWWKNTPASIHPAERAARRATMAMAFSVKWTEDGLDSY
jgi:hypothetical protein